MKLELSIVHDRILMCVFFNESHCYRLYREQKFLSYSPQTSKYPQGFFQQFLEKAPDQIWDKMIDLTSKLGEINDIEHNKGSKLSSESSYF